MSDKRHFQGVKLKLHLFDLFLHLLYNKLYNKIHNILTCRRAV